ncbi:uncharacterized protein LOC119465211 isoform X4 [Dermacentor silvarum]|uniref:uncharacterized protein LOC119465211 isoform X4 n=1 Tax=Dermacentor silvarum TaxID=543639 RepID=UPI0021012525|nr:uncharacterized protein LOC119465211 isoform X4 [Dermacentor silvarum]
MRSVCALLLAMAVATGSARRSLLEEKRVDVLGVDDKARPGSDGSDHSEKPGANDCDKNKFREGITNCENGLKPLEKYLTEKKNDDSCKLLKIYLSCIEDFQLFLSCENDPASQKEMAKATSIIVKNRLNCTELAFLTANITSKLPPQNAAAVNKSTSAATKASDKKCEERSLVLKLNQCVRLLNKTVEPILEDKENNKLNICRASDTFLLCVNEAVSETACREDSEVMFHVSHFADKILRHHKWSCDQAGASSNRPRLENLRQKMDANGSGNLTAARSLNGGGPTALVPADNKCNFEIVRTAVDTCQQSAYDQIKKKGISQPKHLCVELRIFKDCSIEATKKNGCSSDKNAETYVYDRVKDSFYKYLTDCRPLWSAAAPMSTSFWALSAAILLVLAQQRH